MTRVSHGLACISMAALCLRYPPPLASGLSLIRSRVSSCYSVSSTVKTELNRRPCPIVHSRQSSRVFSLTLVAAGSAQQSLATLQLFIQHRSYLKGTPSLCVLPYRFICLLVVDNPTNSSRFRLAFLRPPITTPALSWRKRRYTQIEASCQLHEHLRACWCRCLRLSPIRRCQSPSLISPKLPLIKYISQNNLAKMLTKPRHLHCSN